MKTLKFLAATGLLAAAAAAVAVENSSVISEQAGAKNSTVTANVAVQAPAPAPKQKTALSPEEWKRVLAAQSGGHERLYRAQPAVLRKLPRQGRHCRYT